MEHAVAFDDGGATDVANVAPVSRRWHTRKTNGDIDLHRDPDTGVATWTATASGYTVVTWPSPHTEVQFAQRPARPGGAGPDDPARTDRLTPPALTALQATPHPANIACVVRDADGHVLHDGRAPP